MSKSQKGYFYFDPQRKKWVGRYSPVDPRTGKQRNIKVSHDNKSQAAQLLRERIRELEKATDEPAVRQKTQMAEIAEEFRAQKLVEAEYVKERKIAGRRELSAPTAWLKQILYYFGERRLDSVRVIDLENFKRWLAKLPVRSVIQPTKKGWRLIENKSGGTRSLEAVNRPLELLRTIFTFAVENGYLAEKLNPFRLAKGLIDRHAESKSERFPAFGEELALLAQCGRERAHLCAILIVAADTGLRRNERTTLEIRDVDFGANLIRVRQINAKANRAREVPMTRRVVAELKALCRGRNQAEPVFYGVRETRKSFATACRLAAIEGLVLHSFRHRFVTCAFLADIPKAVVLKASGHSSEEWKTYLNVAPECLSPQSWADDKQKRGGVPFQRRTRRRRIQSPLAVSREGRTRVGVIPKPVPECGLRSPS